MQRARSPSDHPPVFGATASTSYSTTADRKAAWSTTRPRWWVITSLHIGGHDNHLDDPGVQELLELALTDQLAAGLLSRFLRGDRTVTGQLCERMVVLRV